MNRRELQLAALAMLSVGPGAGSSWAAKRPLLTLSGRLQRTNDATGQSYAFGEAELLGLPQRHITTATIWTPVARFTGPALADVLAHVQAAGEVIQLTALNDYSVEVPWADLARYAPILAHSRDGQRMGVAKYGPLWLMYPRDDFRAELSGRVATSRFIWQVHAIKVI
jgi:hypothetical protein